MTEVLWLADRADWHEATPMRRGEVTWLKVIESFSVRHAVWPWRGVKFLWPRQKRGNSSVHCPISLKPLSHDHNHALTRFICQYWLIVTAPPAGRQEVTCFILWCTAPGWFTIYSSNELRQVIGQCSAFWLFLKPCKHWGDAKVDSLPKETKMS